MSPLDFAAGGAKMARAELEMVRAFRASVDLAFVHERLRLERAKLAAIGDSRYEDFLGGQYVIAEEIFELSEELAIVAAYRVVELNAKRLTRWLDKDYQRFSWPSFEKLFRAKTNRLLHDLQGARAVDELRLLNNAIKHEAKVSQDLAHYPGWTIGARVHPLGEHFERLAPAIPTFIEALGRAVLPIKLGGERANGEVFPPKQGTA